MLSLSGGVNRACKTLWWIGRGRAALQRLELAVPLLGIIFVGWPTSTDAQPANDNCAAAIVISDWRYRDSEDISAATTQASDPVHACWNVFSGTGQQDRSNVWYKFSAPTTGMVTIDLAGSDYRAVLGTYSGSCQALSGVTLNGVQRSVEASCTSLSSQPWPVSFPVEAGKDYLIEIAKSRTDGVGGRNLQFKFDFLRPLNWQFKTAPPESNGLDKVRVDRDDSNVWYVGSKNGVYITRDGGTSWEHHLDGLTWGLALDPKNNSRLYAGSGNELYRSDDKGRTWCLIKAFPDDESIYSIVVSPTDGAIFVGMHWGASDNANGLYKTVDQGATWTLHPFNLAPLPYNQHTGLITWDIAEDAVNGYLYLGTEPQQKPTCTPCYNAPTLRSTDRGQTWQDISPNPLSWHASRIQVHPITQAVYFQIEGGAVFVSNDLGTTWQQKGLNRGWDLLIDPRDPTTFFSGGTDGTIMLSIYNAQSFSSVGPAGLSAPSQISVGLSSDSTKLLAAFVAQTQPTGVYVADLSLGTAPPITGSSGSTAPSASESDVIILPCFARDRILVWPTSYWAFIVIAAVIAAIITAWFRRWPPRPEPPPSPIA